jgi:hypothetical protein
MSPPNAIFNSDDKARLANAVQWLQENLGEKAMTASWIFKANPHSIRVAIARAKRRSIGKVTKRGGQNKILSNSQEEAIQSYCLEQSEAGLGATRQMVYSAISFLLSQEEPPRLPPTWRWFNGWITNHSSLHPIKTKPIARNRVDTYSEKDLEGWFEKYRIMLNKYNISKSRNI